MILEHTVPFIYNFIRPQFLLDVRQIRDVQIGETAVGVVAVIYHIWRHIWVLSVVRRLIFIAVSLQTLLLLLMFPIVEALNHLVVLVVDEVVVIEVGIRVLVISASITLLIWIKSLRPLLLTLQIKSIAPLVHCRPSSVMACFGLLVSKCWSVLVVQAVIWMNWPLVARRVHRSSKLHFLLRTPDICADRPGLVLTLG